MVWRLLACTADTRNVCSTGNDDVCDELQTCELGTDRTDCITACAKWNPNDGDIDGVSGMSTVTID